MMQPLASSPSDDGLAIFQAGLVAADPYAAVQHCLLPDVTQKALQIRLAPGSQACRTGHWQAIHLIAFGKAARAMAMAAADSLSAIHTLKTALIVTTSDQAGALPGFEVFTAGHPIPDANGLLAAQAVANRLQMAKANELVLLLISGGGSALLPYPVAGVSLAEKMRVTTKLLACGANINQVNCVRKHLSRLKGGGMARLAAPADCHSLILSDVLGDDVSSIASGPSVADTSSFSDAITVLKDFAIWEDMPHSVQTYLQQGAMGLQPETLKPADPCLANHAYTLVASNAISLSAALEAAENLGYQPHVYSQHLCGEARQVAADWVQAVKQCLLSGLNQPLAWIAGGETTVTVRGTGQGGRNQEMALAFALAAEIDELKADWHFFSIGTDGRDGPTDAAGGMVNRGTLTKIRHAGIDPNLALDNNDAYTALKAGAGLVVTGATGTNVADLQILLLQPLSE